MNELKDLEQKTVDTGHWRFFGTLMQQTPKAVDSINRLLYYYNDFANIIEIGSSYNGLSVFLALYCNLSPKTPHTPRNPNKPQFYSFDIEVRNFDGVVFLRQMGANFILGDTLNDQNVIAGIRQLIGAPGRTLLICDGGDKIKEFELYAPFLKQGDYVLVHDYAKDTAEAAKKKAAGIWGFHESNLAALQPTISSANVQEVFEEEFYDAAFFCGRKENPQMANVLPIPQLVTLDLKDLLKQRQ